MNRERKGDWLLVVAVIALLVAVIPTVYWQVRSDQISGRLGDLETRLVAAEASYPEAAALLRTREPQFAKKWSTDLIQEQVSVDSSITAGQIKSKLKQARSASNVDDASQLADTGETLLQKVEDFVNKIQGNGTDRPYFDVLKEKATNASADIAKIPQNIIDARAKIDAFKKETWNVQNGITLERAYQKLKSVDALLVIAQTDLQTQLVGDNVAVDFVQAFNDGLIANTAISDAVSYAQTDTTMAPQAHQAILTAQTAISSAQAYINLSHYNTYAANDQLNTVRDTYNVAVGYYYGDKSKEIFPDYSLAYSKANDVVTDASQAQLLAATPTPIPPTPIPIPTSVPQASSPIVIFGGGSNAADDQNDWVHSSGGSISNDYEAPSSDWSSPSSDFGDDNFDNPGWEVDDGF